MGDLASSVRPEYWLGQVSWADSLDVHESKAGSGRKCVRKARGGAALVKDMGCGSLMQARWHWRFFQGDEVVGLVQSIQGLFQPNGWHCSAVVDTGLRTAHNPKCRATRGTGCQSEVPATPPRLRLWGFFSDCCGEVPEKREAFLLLGWILCFG